MSRIGKKILAIPPKTEVTIAGNVVTVKGPLGEIKREFRPEITVTNEAGAITVVPKKLTLQTKALWGTVASHINNMIEGVNKMFEKRLVIEGIGFKVDVKPTELIFSLGFSHTIKLQIPKGLKIVLDKGILVISGVDKDMVGGFSAKIRSYKKPEPYKGKGIRYETEVIRRKQCKKTT